MTRKLLQSVLCVCTSPLLVAQTSFASPAQNPPAKPEAAIVPSRVTIPKGTKVELISLENLSSATAVAGSSVRFAVAQDVIVRGVVVMPAGAPVTATITKAIPGVAHHRWAGLTIQVREMQIGNGPKLRLAASDPKNRASFKDDAQCAALLPLCVALLIAFRDGCGEDGCPVKKLADGQQAVLPRCVAEDFWVNSSLVVSAASLAEEKASAATYSKDPCPWVVARAKVFGDPGISYVDFK